MSTNTSDYAFRRVNVDAFDEVRCPSCAPRDTSWYTVGSNVSPCKKNGAAKKRLGVDTSSRLVHYMAA